MSRILWLVGGVLALSLGWSDLKAQVSSPYSINGVGDIQTLALPHQVGMGGIGISNPSPWHLNNQNPALLPYNNLTVFQMGLSVDRRQISTDSDNNTNLSGRLNNINFGFPIKPNLWTMSIGLMPYSTVNYNISIEQVVPGTEIPVVINYEGDGGLGQIYWSNGFKIWKGISLGLKFNYFFGSIENFTRGFLGDENFSSETVTEFERQTTYNGPSFGAGLHYQLKLNEKHKVNFGFTYEHSTNLKGKRFESLIRRTSSNAPTVGGDTLTSELSGRLRIPHQLGFGLSYQLNYNLTAGIDFTYGKWSNATAFDEDIANFEDTKRLAFGVEWVPDPNNVNSYVKRISYRLGFSLEESPYVVNNQTVNDLGINFGWSLPIGGVSSLDFAFKLGQRGQLENNLIQERYFQVQLGATINDRWFVRRKLN